MNPVAKWFETILEAIPELPPEQEEHINDILIGFFDEAYQMGLDHGKLNANEDKL